MTASDARYERSHLRSFKLQIVTEVFGIARKMKVAACCFFARSRETNAENRREVNGLHVAPNRARARGKEMRAEFRFHFTLRRDTSTWETRASLLHVRNSHNKWRNKTPTTGTPSSHETRGLGAEEQACRDSVDWQSSNVEANVSFPLCNVGDTETDYCHIYKNILMKTKKCI